MNKIKFSCGCELPQDENGRIIFKCDWDNINYDCPATWDLLNSGNVKICFQIESSFGQQLSKRMNMKSIDELSDLISIMRPSCTEAYLEDGKNLTEHYIKRHRKEEEPKPFHPAIEPFLRDTQQILIFQEQASKIVMSIAGFTGSEADDLRKACAKKRADLMAPLKEKFLNGCKKIGLVQEHEAENVWQWLEAGQRYGFNRSVEENTTVTTPEGEKTIQQLKVGDYVLAPKNNNEDHFIKVVEKYDHGIQEVFLLTLEDGKEIKCTMDHKFLTNIGKVLPLREIINNNLEIMVY